MHYLAFSLLRNFRASANCSEVNFFFKRELKTGTETSRNSNKLPNFLHSTLMSSKLSAIHSSSSKSSSVRTLERSNVVDKAFSPLCVCKASSAERRLIAEQQTRTTKGNLFLAGNKPFLVRQFTTLRVKNPCN